MEQRDKYVAVSSDDGEVLEISQEDLESAMYERICQALIALEDEFDMDKASELLRD